VRIKSFFKAMAEVKYELREINRKMDKILVVPEHGELEGMEAIMKPLDFILGIPDHLRNTFLMVLKLGGTHISAQRIADVTGHCRPMESSKLCQLVSLGKLRKNREGRKVYFSIS